jgi:hypothetical protein
VVVDDIRPWPTRSVGAQRRGQFMVAAAKLLCPSRIGFERREGVVPVCDSERCARVFVIKISRHR